MGHLVIRWLKRPDFEKTAIALWIQEVNCFVVDKKAHKFFNKWLKAQLFTERLNSSKVLEGKSTMV